MIAVKKLEEDRWKEYRDLRLEALKKEPIAFGSSYDEEKNISEEEWRRRIGNALFALSKDKLIGMIVYTRGNKIKTKHVANIYGVYVTKEYRGQGVGRKLIDRVLEEKDQNSPYKINKFACSQYLNTKPTCGVRLKVCPIGNQRTR